VTQITGGLGGLRVGARDRDERVVVELEDLLGLVVEDARGRGGPAIGHVEHPPVKLHGDDYGGGTVGLERRNAEAGQQAGEVAAGGLGLKGRGLERAPCSRVHGARWR